MLIDAHHHLWSADAADGYEAAYSRADYLADIADCDVAASIFVECLTHYDASLPAALQSIGETRFAAATASACPTAGTALCSAIIANADPLADMPFDAILDAHEDAAKGRLRGIRRCAAWDEDASLTYASLATREGMLSDPRYAAALRILAERGLLFETWVYHPQVGEVAALARSVPACTVVLDHAGTPLACGRHAGFEKTDPLWRDAIARAAEMPNLVVKIGGFATPGTVVDAIRIARGLDRWSAPALAEALAPRLDHLIGCFGPERCLFESNFPVDRATCDFAVLLAAYRLALAGLRETDRARIFGTNAARIYGVRTPVASA